MTSTDTQAWQAIGPGFWNLRGSFKLGGVVDIKTHVSLVQRANGKFVFRESYTLPPAARAEVDALTNGGADVEAVLNLHPFHTVHVPQMQADFPEARHYGSARHVAQHPEGDWQPGRVEDDAVQAEFSEDLRFSVPAGVDYISANPNVHFSSVLAYHPASGTIHSDDTLMVLQLPGPLGGLGRSVRFHMTLAQALERRPGAAEDFRAWAEQLADDWGDAQNLCAAHVANLTAADNGGAPIQARIRSALDSVAGTLRRHRKRHG